MKKNIFAALFLLAPALCTAAEAPNLLTYQGRLKESGLAVTGNRTVEIFLCSTESPGPACETTQPQLVAVSNGLFRSTFTVPGSVDLTTGNWWLEIKVGAATLTPRERLTSGAYALYAGTAAYAQNISAAAGSDGVFVSSNLYVAGNEFSVGGSTLATKYGRVGVGTGDPQAPLDIVSTGTASDIYAQIWRNGAGTIVASMTSQGALFATLPPGSGDGLGTHNASNNLQMNWNSIYTVSTVAARGDITAARYQVDGSTVLAVLPGLKSLAVGVDAGRLSQGNENTFVGYYSGNNNTSGGSNSFFGALAGEVNANGGNNSFFGAYSGHDNSGGVRNNFFGVSAGYGNNAGNDNAFFGAEAGRNNTGGSRNVGLGGEAAKGAAPNSFSDVVAIGYQAGLALTTGSGNIFVGKGAGASVGSGSNNIVIGAGQDVSVPSANSQLNIGGVLFGDLSARTIGISTRAPAAALDLVSTGTAVNIYAQIWRNGSGTEVASMTSQGVLYATLPPGSGDGLGTHSATQDLTLNAFNINSAAQLTVSTITGPGSAYIYVNHNLAFPSSLLAIGNGISSSGYPLAVYGDSGAIAPVLNLENKTNAPGSGIGVRFSAAGTGWGALSVVDETPTGGSTSMRFETFSGEVMRLHGPRMGVGAAAPDQKLTVNGNISQTGVIISSGTGDNYFAGRVGINDTTPSEALDVTGNINATGSLCIGGNCKSAWPADPGSQDLNLAQHSLLAVSSLTIYGSGLQIATDLTSSGNGIFISTAGSLQTLGFGNGTAAPNPRGIGAVDLQTKRTVTDQVASGIYSVIGGGSNNKASTPGSVVAGGQNNYAGVNSYATVSGGSSNSALMTYATVGGGSSNAASEAWAFVGGGGSNKAQQTGAAVTGGQYNVASASNSAVGGGKYNTVAGTSAVVSGGENNAAGGMWSGVAGGRNNAAGGKSASIGGGENNAVSADYSAIAGGLDNSVTQPESFIGGGQGNSVTQSWSVIAGGNYNTASGQRAFVGGGVYNTAGGTASMVPGGWKNSAMASFSFAAGKGSSSTASGAFTWADSKTEPDSGYYLENTVEDRVVYKAVGGFMVVNSTSTALYGTRNRGIFVTGGGLLGISTGTPGAALDVVSTGSAVTDYAQIWRNSLGTSVATMTATGMMQTAKLEVGGDVFRVAVSSTITSASDPCSAGEIRWDASFVYVCVAANTWRRATLGTW